MRFLHRVRVHRPTLLVAVVLPLVLLLAALTLTPAPGALVLRVYYDKSGAATSVETDHYASSAGITQQLNVSYRAGGGADTQFDFYRLTNATTDSPTVIWLHGGGWLGGDKSTVAPFAWKIAAGGFNVAVVNYPLAPEHPYPQAIVAINQAVSYLKASASLLHIDTTRFVIAGDSAGANLASQYAALVSNPDYATQVSISPSLRLNELRGTVLDCGVYDVAAVARLPWSTRLPTQLELWSYTGSQNAATSTAGQQMSTLAAVTAQFPATWITGGDADPLTATQSVPFATKLKSLGVSVTEQFFQGQDAAGLPHEYQFMLALGQARTSFSQMMQFLRSIT